MIRRRWIMLPGLLALFLVLLPAVVSAHTELVSSEPAADALLATPPERVRLLFSEPIEPDFFALEVYSEERVRVDTGNAQVPADNIAALEASLGTLRPGTYTVVWRVLSIDSHVVRGTFAFTIGTVPGRGPALELPANGAPFELGASVRWATFLLAFLLIGGLMFLPLILWPALCSADVSDPAELQRATGRFLWLAWPALVLLLALSLGGLVIQAADVSGLSLTQVFEGRAITRLVTGTKFGTLWLVRMGLLIGLVAMIAVVSSEQRPRLATRWIALLFGAGVLLTIAASGHASAVPRQTALTIAADWAHLLAGAIWTGGLLQLAVSLLPALRALERDKRRLVLAGVVRRFSVVAGASVAVLVGTGLFAGLLHVPSWQALLDTAYGAALSGKLILFVLVLVFGALNLLVMHPRFVRASRTKPTTREDSGTLRWFRTLVLSEIVVVVLILGATAILTGVPPATTAPGEGRAFQETRPLGTVNATLVVTPNRAGTNRIEIGLTDQQGQPVTVEQVRLSLHHMDMAMGQREVTAEPVGPGQYQASGNFLSMGGRWQADVQVQSVGAANATGSFRFTTGQSDDVRRPAFSPARILVNALSPGAALGPVALFLALLIFVQRSSWRRSRDRRHGAWLASALVLVGIIVTVSTLETAYRASLPNPIPATAESMARGREIYGPSCASCHGATGRGDGPAGFTLRPRPADFRLHMAAGHTDAQLFGWIQGGVDGTGMPAFADQLTDEEIWHVVNYIRAFAPGRESP